MRQLAIFFCLGIHFTFLSQSIGTIQQDIAICNNDTQKVNLINLLAWNLKDSKPDTSILLSRQALKLSEVLQWKKGIARSLHQLGVFHYYKGNSDSALWYYEQAQMLWKELIKSKNQKEILAGKTGIAKTLGNMGIIHQSLSNNKMALDYYTKAYQINEELNDKAGMARDLINIGTVYKDQSDFSKATEYYYSSLKLAQDLNLKEMHANILSNIGILYENLGDHKKALDYLLSSFSMGEKLGLHKLNANNLGNLGNVYVAKGEYPKALIYHKKALSKAEVMGDYRGMASHIGNIANVYGLQAQNKNLDEIAKIKLNELALTNYAKALQLNKQLNDKNGVTTNVLNIGLLHLRNKDYSAAERFILEALIMCKEQSAKGLIMVCELNLSDLYLLSGKYERAFDHYKNYISVRDIINNEENNKRQVKAELNFEFEKKQAVMNEQQEKERILAKERDNFHQLVIVSVVTGIIGVCLFLLWIFRTLKITKQQKLIIEEKQKEILDSIHYAKRIQTSLLPTKIYMEKAMKGQKQNN